MQRIGELLDAYAYEMEIASASYEMMGQMLDKECIRKRVKKAALSDVYIYGGGYLGIQLYQVINQFTNVLAIIDKSGGLLLDIPDIPVFSLEEFKCTYQQQKVIITPIKYYQSIYKDLSAFVPDEKLIYLGEFLGGKL